MLLNTSSEVKVSRTPRFVSSCSGCEQRRWRLARLRRGAMPYRHLLLPDSCSSAARTPTGPVRGTLASIALGAKCSFSSTLPPPCPSTRATLLSMPKTTTQCCNHAALAAEQRRSRLLTLPSQQSNTGRRGCSRCLSSRASRHLQRRTAPRGMACLFCDRIESPASTLPTQV